MQPNDNDMKVLWMMAPFRRMVQRIPLTAYISKRTTTKMLNVGLASKLRMEIQSIARLSCCHLRADELEYFNACAHTSLPAILWRHALHRLASTCLALLQTLQGKGDNISDSCLSSQLVFQRHRHSDRRSRHQQTHGKSCTNTCLLIHEYTMQLNDNDITVLWMVGCVLNRRTVQMTQNTEVI